ncbi:hypothetical protein [Paraburkholderia sp. J8-2]|uniref:hypothetical protein n=1 Tax=Paraburkholderia sp. J8-2 TaxID=2805440 RepID=UPI002AB5FA3F|nr:hypothetical protein [Paraburkholderia sp. J8-2]
MNRSEKGSARHSAFAKRNRHKKGLFLPMERSAANKLVLPIRLALETLRRGRGRRDAIFSMVEVTLLVGFLIEAGDSVISKETVDSAERRLHRALEDLGGSDGMELDPELVETLTVVVNEYDRVLREARLISILEANERLGAFTHAAVAERRHLDA